MTNEQIISKMKDDMKMRGFSHWTEESYLLKTKDIIKYFKKSMEKVEIEEQGVLIKTYIQSINKNKKILKNHLHLQKNCIK